MVGGEELLLLEYEHLKEEQRLRIGTRDNLVYATLGSLALVVAGVAQIGKVELLLLAPPVCVLLGWTYVINDDRITAIGRYIEASLGPQLVRIAQPGIPVFAWEIAHRRDRRRRSRKVWQLAVDLLLFVGGPVAALATTVTYRPPTERLLVAVAGELLGVAMLGWQIIGRIVRP